MRILITAFTFPCLYIKTQKGTYTFVRIRVLNIIFLCWRSYFGTKLEILASNWFKTIRFLSCDEGVLEISPEKASKLIILYLKQAGYPKSYQLYCKIQVAQTAWKPECSTLASPFLCATEAIKPTGKRAQRTLSAINCRYSMALTEQCLEPLEILHLSFWISTK